MERIPINYTLEEAWRASLQILVPEAWIGDSRVNAPMRALDGLMLASAAALYRMRM